MCSRFPIELSVGGVGCWRACHKGGQQASLPTSGVASQGVIDTALTPGVGRSLTTLRPESRRRITTMPKR